jgi:hypothetical protein
VAGSKESEFLGEWDTGHLDGLYTLLLTVVRQDGSFSEVSVPVTIDNIPPTVEIISPISGQSFPTSDQRVTIRVSTSDNLSVTQVKFYLDDDESAFAASTEPPFAAEWRLSVAGCYDLYAVALDAAGNETRSTAVPLCLAESD